MIYNLVKYLFQTQLRLWDIKITNFKPESCPNDLLEICYFYISQTKSSLDKIFYKVVYHHIIYMCDFLVNLKKIVVIYTSFHENCSFHQIRCRNNNHRGTDGCGDLVRMGKLHCMVWKMTVSLLIFEVRTHGFMHSEIWIPARKPQNIDETQSMLCLIWFFFFGKKAINISWNKFVWSKKWERKGWTMRPYRTRPMKPNKTR